MESRTSLKILIDEQILQEQNAMVESLMADLARHLNNHRRRVLEIVSEHPQIAMEPQQFSAQPCIHAEIKDAAKANNETREKNVTLETNETLQKNETQANTETQEITDEPDSCTKSQQDPGTPIQREYNDARLNELAGIDMEEPPENYSLVQKIVKSHTFEVASAGLIVALMVVMCSEIQYQGMNSGYALKVPGYARPGFVSWPHAETVFESAEMFFNVVFTFELVLRLVAFKINSFKSGWVWLDLTLVCLSWADVFGVLSFGVDPMMLRLFRLVRLLRLVKVFKAFKAVETLFLLIKSIQSSFSVLMWSFLLLMCVTTATGIALAQLLSGFINDETKPVEVRKSVFKYFGTMSNSCLTMFEIIQGNWVVSCRLLYVEVSEWYAPFYIWFRCCMMFGVIKVISAVFIAETNRNANSDDELALAKKNRQKDEYAAKLRSVFSELDDTGDGVLSWEELDRLLNDDWLKSLLSTLEIDTHELQYVFQALDNGDNQIEFSEFMGGLTKVRGPAKGLDVFKVLCTVGKIEGKVNTLVGEVSKLQQQSTCAGEIHHGNTDLEGKMDSL